MIASCIDEGRKTANFTSTNQLFLENPHIRYWRFEVVYSFGREIGSGALNFVINQPPSNGSCSISPSQGTTSTLFTVACSNWFDEDGIKGYALSGYTVHPDEQTMLAFSSVADFTARLPSPDGNQTHLNLMVTIRDALDCVTYFNVSTVVVTADVSSISQFVDALSNSNPLARLLSSGNQNTVAQLITSLSQHFNQIDGQNVADALSSTDLQLILFHTRVPPFRWCAVREYLCFLLDGCHVSTSTMTIIEGRSISLP